MVPVKMRYKKVSEITADKRVLLIRIMVMISSMMTQDKLLKINYKH